MKSCFDDIESMIPMAGPDPNSKYKLVVVGDIQEVSKVPYSRLNTLKMSNKLFPLYPWWKKDKYGFPIELYIDKPIKNFFRIICQNIRKVIK